MIQIGVIVDTDESTGRVKVRIPHIDGEGDTIFAANSSFAGMTEEEFNAFYWDSTKNTGLHGGSKNSDGKKRDFR